MRYAALSLLLALAALWPLAARADDGRVIADRWYVEPLLYPQLGYQSYSSSAGSIGIATTGLGVGGLAHDLRGDFFSGRARVEGSIWTGGDGFGFEVKAGPSWTPRRKFFGARIGVDPFYNRFTSTVFNLPATFGVELPVDLLLGPRRAHLITGLTPAIVTNPDRRVDWSKVDSPMPIGHESEWRLGFGLTLGRFTVSLVYSERTTIMGVASGVGVGFSSAPYVPPDLRK